MAHADRHGAAQGGGCSARAVKGGADGPVPARPESFSPSESPCARELGAPTSTVVARLARRRAQVSRSNLARWLVAVGAPGPGWVDSRTSDASAAELLPRCSPPERAAIQLWKVSSSTSGCCVLGAPRKQRQVLGATAGPARRVRCAFSTRRPAGARRFEPRRPMSPSCAKACR